MQWRDKAPCCKAIDANTEDTEGSYGRFVTLPYLWPENISVKEIRVVSLLVCALTGFFASSCWGIANGTHGHHGVTVPVLVVLVFQPYNCFRWKKRLTQLGLKFHFKAKLWQLRFSSAWDGTSKTHTKLHCSYRRWRGTKGTIWKQKKDNQTNQTAEMLDLEMFEN